MIFEERKPMVSNDLTPEEVEEQLKRMQYKPKSYKGEDKQNPLSPGMF
jgi:hypothetical protein